MTLGNNGLRLEPEQHRQQQAQDRGGHQHGTIPAEGLGREIDGNLNRHTCHHNLSPRAFVTGVGMRSYRSVEDASWRTHFCVPCSHSCEHPLRSSPSVHMSVNAARRSACATTLWWASGPMGTPLKTLCRTLFCHAPTDSR